MYNSFTVFLKYFATEPKSSDDDHAQIIRALHKDLGGGSPMEVLYS